MGPAMAAAGIGTAQLADLAARRVVLERRFPVSLLPRLAALGPLPKGIDDQSGPGQIDARFAFQPGPEGFPQVRITATGAVRLRCQRCLGPLVWPVAVDETLTIIAADEAASGLEDPFATVLLEADQLPLTRAVEDEVLAALPLAPRHTDEAACAELAGAAPGEVHRPFAGLASLLGKGGGPRNVEE